MRKPLVSVIVVNLNGNGYLSECIDSVLAQTYPHLEIVLVDNGSKDGSSDRARAKYGDRLRFIANPVNLGYARANNQAITASSGDWIFLLNNDAVLDICAISELVAFANERPEIGMLACRVLQYDHPNVFDSTGLLLYPDGTSRPRGWEEKDLGQYDRPDEVIAPHGCAAAFYRPMLDDVGLFDEDYFAYLEDVDLGVRGWLRNWRCWYVPTAIARHRKSSTFGNYSSFKAYHVERNRIYNAVKLLPLHLLIMSPWRTAVRYLLQAYAAHTHRGSPAQFMKEYSVLQLLCILARAYAAALLQLPTMWTRRRQIAATRRISRSEWHRLIRRFELDAIELALKF